MTLNVNVSFLFPLYITTKRRTYANEKLYKNEKMAWATPKKI